jgi:hypothetical protein
MVRGSLRRRSLGDDHGFRGVTGWGIYGGTVRSPI